MCEALLVLEEVDAEVTRFGSYFINTEKLLKHKGHCIGIKSEYGYLLDDCNKEYKCDACGNIERCHRKKSHDGPCNKVRDYRPGKDE